MYKKKITTVAIGTSFALALVFLSFTSRPDTTLVNESIIHKELETYSPTSSKAKNNVIKNSATTSLQSYIDSNEYKAAKVWYYTSINHFIDSPPSKSDEESFIESDEKYDAYGIHSQDMANKLDEITNKFQLKLHQNAISISSNNELFKNADTKDFLGKMNQVISGQFYDDGSFYYEGRVTLANGYEFSYLMQNTVKGYFNDLLFSDDGMFAIGEATDYEERLYKTKSGITVSISQNETFGHIDANLENNFIHISFYADNIETGIATNKVFEMIADSIDFREVGRYIHH
jgi:hypothetical protein